MREDKTDAAVAADGQVSLSGPGQVATVAIVVVFLAHALVLWVQRGHQALTGSLGSAPLAAEAALAAACLLWASRRKAAVGASARVVRGWAVLAAALLCFSLGNLYGVLNSGVANGAVFPSLADALFLLFYGLFFIGLLLLPDDPLKRRELPRMFLDMALVVLAVLLTYWLFTENGVVGSGGQPFGSPIAEGGLAAMADRRAWVLLAYALMGITVIYAAIAVLQRQTQTGSRQPLAALAASAVLIMGGDTVYSYQQVQGVQPLSGVLALFYVAGVLAACLAGIAQVRDAQPKPAGHGGGAGDELRRSDRVSLGLTYGLLVLAWIFLIWRLPTSSPAGGITQLAMAGAMIAVLAMVRQVLWHDNVNLTYQLQRELDERKRVEDDLEARVQERTTELVRVNDELRREATELDQAQKALRESEALYRRLVETSPDGIALANLSGTIVVCNDNLAQLAGYERAPDLIGHNVFDMVVGRRRHDVTAYARRILIQGSVRDVEIIVTRKDGTLGYASLNASLVSDERGKPAAVIGVLRDITERKQVEDKLRHVSTHDALTGARNRAFFDDELKRLQQTGKFPVSILVLDVDRFKRTNDTHGHAAGDQMLRKAVALLKRSFRAEDIVARIGGDEFAVILEGADISVAEAAVQRLRDNLVVANLTRDRLPLGLSTGAATALKGATLNAALRRADARMYADKVAHGIATAGRAGTNQDGDFDD